MSDTRIPGTDSAENAVRALSAPAWTSAYKLPAQLEAELAIAELEEKIQQLHAELRAVSERLPEAARFASLLFEQNAALQWPVRDALELLGGTVNPEAGQEEPSLRVADPRARIFLVDIAGDAGPVMASQIRHLLDSEFDAADRDPQWSGKTLLVANPYCNIAPGEREEPFPVSGVRMAARFGQCILPTTQLFEAVRQFQIGMFDKSAFWDALYKTVGVCTLAEPAALGVQEDDARAVA